MLRVVVRARIAILYLRAGANKLSLFQMMGFYGLLARNKARTKVLPLLLPTYSRPFMKSVQSCFCSANFLRLF